MTAERRVAVLACTAALPAACGGGSSQPALTTSSLRPLVLQPAQMQSYAQFDAGRQSRTDLHRGPRGDATRFGRIGGWKARYKRAGGTATTAGPLLVESRADAFRSGGGAKKDLAAYADEWKQTVTAAGATAAAYFAVSGLGDEARGVDLVQGPRATGQRLIVVAWRRGPVTASVSAMGLASKLTRAPVVALARKQDAAVERAV